MTGFLLLLVVGMVMLMSKLLIQSSLEIIVDAFLGVFFSAASGVVASRHTILFLLRSLATATSAAMTVAATHNFSLSLSLFPSLARLVAAEINKKGTAPMVAVAGW